MVILSQLGPNNPPPPELSMQLTCTMKVRIETELGTNFEKRRHNGVKHKGPNYMLKIDHTSSLKLKPTTVTIKGHVRCEVFTPEVMKGFIFCDAFSYSVTEQNG
jgi:hypothetical protein